MATILPPDAFFYTVRAAGAQVGVASITVDTLSDGLQITERLLLDLPIRATSTRSQFTIQYTLGTDLGLRDFRLTLPGGDNPIIQQGRLEGDSLVVVAPGTGEPSRRIPVRPFTLMPPLAAGVLLALQRNLRTGQRRVFPVFDPVTQSEGTIQISVLDDSVFTVADSAEYDSLGSAWIVAHVDTLRAWKLEWRTGGIASIVWVDPRGLPIRVLSPAGLSLDRSAFEIVTINYRRQRNARPAERPGSVIPRSAIASGAVPEGGVTSMRVLIQAEGQPWNPPGDSLAQAAQFLSGDTVVTRIGDWDPAADGYSLPSSDTLLPRWREDEPLLGIHDAAIVNRAREIAGGTSNPATAAAQLATWVSQNIKRTAEPVVLRAATVLRNRQADVDGHTVLYVALARAAGLPARSMAGLLLAGDRFYFHSWAEVYLGRWVAVDPTWGGFPADAGRIRVAVGALARPLEMLPRVAGLEVRLLNRTKRP